jgi:hypothetical protein
VADTPCARPGERTVKRKLDSTRFLPPIASVIALHLLPEFVERVRGVTGSWCKGGGMVFPQFHIDAIKRAEQRDLTRFDLDFDLPDHFLPEFPAPIFLTTRPDLGDVSKGQVVTINNFHELFNGLLNPKQLEGLRLLVTPFPQQQQSTSRGSSLGAAQPWRGLPGLP